MATLDHRKSGVYYKELLGMDVKKTEKQPSLPVLADDPLLEPNLVMTLPQLCDGSAHSVGSGEGDDEVEDSSGLDGDSSRSDGDDGLEDLFGDGPPSKKAKKAKVVVGGAKDRKTKKQDEFAWGPFKFVRATETAPSGRTTHLSQFICDGDKQ